MAAEAAQFLSALFGQKPADSHVLIWTMPDKASHWFTDIDKAAAFAESDQTKNVYVGVSLSPKNFGPTKRCPTRSTVGVVGLWADIDVAGEGHKKPNLPPTTEDAIALLRQMGAKPSIIVHSGHGLQAWWLFKQPWIFSDDADRDKAEDLCKRWCYTLRGYAKERGWDADATWDLARVLRVPGTTNVKGQPVPVKILMATDAYRYDPAEFYPLIKVDEKSLPDPKKRATVAEAIQGRHLDLDPKAEPPEDKMIALAMVEERFDEAWNRSRTDFTDQSASSYDLSLANYAVMAGWTDQEITNLLIASRRKHGDDLKLREDYYLRTIAKARAGCKPEEGASVLANALNEVSAAVDGDDPDPPEPETEPPAPTTDTAADKNDDKKPDEPPAEGGQKADAKGDKAAPKRDKKADKKGDGGRNYMQEIIEYEGEIPDDLRQIGLRLVSAAFSVRVVRIVKYLSDPPQYRLVTDAGEIMLGDVGNLIGQMQLRKAVAAATERYIPKVKGQEWDQLCRILLKIVEKEEIGEEATDRGMAKSWVVDYLSENAPTEDIDDAASEHHPFVKEGQTYIFGAGLRKHLVVTRDERVPAKTMGAMLRLVGCDSEVINVHVGGKPTTRSVWRVPKTLL